MKTYGRKKTDDANDIIVNLDELCRLCLAREEQLVPIFNEDEPIPLPIRIMACVALEVLEDDGLPTMICHPCHYQLEKYYVFRKKCESSDLKLRRQLRQLGGSLPLEVDEQEEPTPGELDLVGSSGTFVIPEEDEIEGDEDVGDDIGAGGSQVEEISLPLDAPGDPGLHCTLKRELTDDDEKEEIGGEVELHTVVNVLHASLATAATDMAETPQDEPLQVRLLPTYDGAPTHVEVTTEDGSVLFMELTTDDTELPQEAERDENGELRVLQCQECPRAFARRAQLRRHVSIHTQQRGVTCSTCEKWFPSKSALKRHERIHTGEKPFQCGVCKRCFAQKEILFRHLLIHSDTKPYTCSTCGKGFTQREPLRIHLMSHMHPRPPLRLHRCNLCTKLFCHASGLSRHLLTHAGRSYKCVDCEKSFNDKSSLRRHHRVTGHRASP